ncbi:hypothetical protein GP486_001241 [Trichoglossum hirsutum]|uniref:Uncharacterized protein n=1 Tax=Trichoglossum hirsutum TaxID=265104 RepID=A0A9P8LHF1_9PEZI|nr:hypothetical protein GP486_001241 [Trichoglossum hirsutum]
MVDPVGSILNIVHVLNSAYTLYKACQGAAEEFRVASGHVHCMVIVLEGVKSDLVENPRCIINRGTDQGRCKVQRLKPFVDNCDKSLGKLKALLGKYNTLKNDRSNGWDKFMWSKSGKSEVAGVQADLMMSTTILNAFLAKEHLDILGRMELVLEQLVEMLNKSGNHGTTDKPKARKETGASSTLGRCILAGLFISRLKSRLRSKKAALLNKTVPRSRGVAATKAAVTVKTGPGPNKRRDTLLGAYANSIVEKQTKVNSNADGSLSGETAIGLTRPKPPTGNATEQIECWRIGSVSLAIGGSVIRSVRLQRGQAQLREMAGLFREASSGNNADYSRDKRVKYILKARKKNNPQYEWLFVAARRERHEISGSGMTTYEQLVVILLRRKR